MIPSNVFLKLHTSFSTLIFSNLSSKLISWLSYNICLCKAAAFASAKENSKIQAGLVFSLKFVDFAVLGDLITYFTESSKYDLRKAAAYVNVQEGLSATLVIVLIYISHTFGSLKIIICSTASFIIGLVLLSLTASHLSLTGSHLSPQSNSDLLNRIGVVLLAVGEAGVKTFIEAFLAGQLRAHEPKTYTHEDQVSARKGAWLLVAFCCGALAVFLFTDAWLETCILSAAVMGSTFILFLWGSRFYHCREACLGSHSPDFRVIRASILKWHLEYPSSPDQFHRNERNRLILWPQKEILRWLDKAAIIESSTPQQAQVNAGRLCTVSQVQELKLLLNMVPMWTTFLVFGLIVSTGNTFFPEQGNNMDDPAFFIYLLIMKSISKGIGGYLSKFLISKLDPKFKKQAQIVRIWAGMVMSIFCIAVAWRVEVHRLKIVNDKGFRDHPDDDTIPMSIFWLAPQFCLLGLMQGLATKGMDEFVIDQFPKSMEDYVSAINEFVIGIGRFMSILCAYANRSLFSSTLNHSRLDKYYKTLAVVSFINFCYYMFVSRMYTCDDETVEAEVQISEISGADAV